jgi:threonine dehydrogenase-like Zn-dependent dehydrogenase
MTKTCRAAVFPGNGTHEIREFEVPDPPPGGALMKVEAVGLCGSDIAQLRGLEMVPGGSAFPVVPGHEVVGRVVKLANDADLGVAEGQRVALNEILSTTPSFRLYGYSDMTGEGKLGLWGGYGEYMQLFPRTVMHKLSDRLDAAQLTLFEPLANAVNWTAIADVQQGETVVVEGPGHQGLAVLVAVLTKNPAQVIVTCTSADGLRLDAARAIGAHQTVVVDKEDLGIAVRDLTGGRGADVVFDIATATASVPAAFDVVRPQGRVLLAGLKHFHPVTLVSDLIVLKGLRVFGGSGFTNDSMAAAVELIETGKVRSDLLLGEVFGLDGIDDAMALLERTLPGRDAARVGLRHENSNED